MKPFTARQPKGRGRAWSRVVTDDGAIVVYRLFRRDHRNVVHQYQLQFMPSLVSRRRIARDLQRAWKELRDQVDEIDLPALEAA